MHGNKGKPKPKPWPKNPYPYAKRPNRVRDVRLLRSITRQELADRAGVSKDYIAFIERGSMPLLKTGEKIAKVLNVDVRFLWPDFQLRANPGWNELFEKDVYPNGLPGLTLADVAQLLGVPEDKVPLDILPEGVYIVGVTDKAHQEKEETMVARLPHKRVPPNRVIKKRRIELGMSQEALARKVNCSLNHISGIELGKAVPSVTIAMSIARVLDLDVNDIFKTVRVSSKQHTEPRKRKQETSTTNPFMS